MVALVHMKYLHRFWLISCIVNVCTRNDCSFSQQIHRQPTTAHSIITSQSEPLTPSLPLRKRRCHWWETWQAPSAACAGFFQRPSAEFPTETPRLHAASCTQPLVLNNSNYCNNANSNSNNYGSTNNVHTCEASEYQHLDWVAKYRVGWHIKRPEHAVRTAENIGIVGQMICSQEDQPGTDE